MRSQTRSQQNHMYSVRHRVIICAFALAASTVFLPTLHGQQSAPADGSNNNNVEQPAQDPLDRPLSDKDKFKQQKELKQELKGPYKKWLDQDVRWIITDQEMHGLQEPRQRRRARRSSSRSSGCAATRIRIRPENEFREEHYRRIAYANEHFAAGKPGWKTDRGHIYIAYGKPDSIDSHPSGGNYERPMEEGGGNTSTFPFEVWHYRYLEGIGDNIDIEFVDTCMCGDYHMTIDRSEKDALKHTPGAGQTLYEQMGQAKQGRPLQRRRAGAAGHRTDVAA